MFIQVSRVGEAITGSYNGKSFGVTFNEERYAAMKDLEAKAAQASSTEELQAIFEEFEPMTKESYKELAETKCKYIFVNNKGKFFLQLKGKTINEPLPQALVDRILESIEKNIDFMPLIKLWIRFLRNPVWKKNVAKARQKGQYLANYINQTYTDYTELEKFLEDGASHELSHQMATRHQTSITQEGLLVLYKVAEELTEKWVLDENGNKKKVKRFKAEIDENTGIVTYKEPDFVEERVFRPAIMKDSGDAFYCGDMGKTNGVAGHIVKVGKLHWLENWNQVNCEDGSVGIGGLHAGNLDYIRSYQGAGTVTHNIFADPAMIGGFTGSGDGAVRLKEYFVYGSFAGVNRSIYHSSEYAKLSDLEYEEMLKASLKDQAEREKERKEAKIASQEEIDDLIGSTVVD